MMSKLRAGKVKPIKGKQFRVAWQHLTIIGADAGAAETIFETNQKAIALLFFATLLGPSGWRGQKLGLLARSRFI